MAAPFTVQIAYLGPAGSHSHAAARRRFTPSPTARVPPIAFKPAPSFPAILDLLKKEEAHYAMMPIENSVSGTVNSSWDAILAASIGSSEGLRAWAEEYLPVNHCLLSNVDLGVEINSDTCLEKDSEALKAQRTRYSAIKRVYSHTEALGQCAKFLDNVLPHAERIRVGSTALAADMASKEEGAAALSSEACVEIYGVKMVERDIQDSATNTTRFLVVSADFAPSPRPLFTPQSSSAPGDPLVIPFLKSILLIIPREASSGAAGAAVAGSGQLAGDFARTQIVSSFTEHKIPLLNVFSRPYLPPPPQPSPEASTIAADSSRTDEPPAFRSWLIIEFASYAGLNVSEVTDYVLRELRTKGVCEKAILFGSWMDESS